MAILDKHLEDEILEMVNGTFTDKTGKTTTELAEILQAAWDLIPGNKHNRVADIVARAFVQHYFYGECYQEAEKWSDIYVDLDSAFSSFGEGHYYAGKIAFELGKTSSALHHFIAARHKGKKWLHSDQKYKEFYEATPDLELLIAAYKESQKPNSFVVTTSIADHPSTRRFDDPSGKIYFILREGMNVQEESGKSGKTKLSGKSFPAEMDAKAYVYKKESDLLKKDFVYRNENAVAGEPVMHHFLIRGYTGALGFTSTPDEIYISAVGQKQDYLQVIDKQGNLKRTLPLPRNLPWEMKYNDFTGLMYVYLDKCIFEFNPETLEFMPLTYPNPREFSNKRFSFGKNVLAFNTKEALLLTHDSRNATQGKFDFTIPKVHDGFAFVLSADGSLLALQNKPETIELIDTATAKTNIAFNIGTNTIGQMKILQDHKTLVVQDMSNYYKIRFFDLETGKEIIYEEIQAGPYQYAFSFCFNTDASRLVISLGYEVRVFDFSSKKLLKVFQLEHCGKKAAISFVGSLLGARTDFGYFSLYNVG